MCSLSTIYKWKQFEMIMSVDFYVRGQQGMDFFTGESVIMHYGQKLRFKVKTS